MLAEVTNTIMSILLIKMHTTFQKLSHFQPHNDSEAMPITFIYLFTQQAFNSHLFMPGNRLDSRI